MRHEQNVRENYLHGMGAELLLPN